VHPGISSQIEAFAVSGDSLRFVRGSMRSRTADGQ